MADAEKNQRQPKDLLTRLILGVATGLATLYAALMLFMGSGPVLPLPTWWLPLMDGFAVLAALSVVFLSFGQYRVLRQPAPFWIGLAFSAYSVLAVFFFLSLQRLVSELTNTIAWFSVLEVTVLAILLLAAAFARWPRAERLGGRLWLWTTLAVVAALAVAGVLSMVFEEFLPLLLVDGSYTPVIIGWYYGILLAFIAGFALSAHRYRHTGDSLLGYAALTELTLFFAILGRLIGGAPTNPWYYGYRILIVGGFSAMLFGLLSEYVGLYRRERENARELAALLQVTDPALARQGLEPLLQSLLKRIVAIMGANAGAILLLDPATQELVLRCGVGIPADQAAGFRVRIGDNFVGRVAARKVVFWVRDAEADPAISSPYIRASHIKGTLGAPMRIGEEVTGVIQVDFLVPREFSPNEERLLEVAAEQAARAIYQAELLEKSERRAAELLELDLLKDQFLSVAAHELKTPVTGIKGYAQLLLRWEHDGISPRGLKALEAIDRQSGRISRLVNELLETSRIQTGRLELLPTKFDLSQLAAEIVEGMKIATEKHRLLFQSPGPVLVNADRERIGEVLSTLLDNAIKFSPQGGDIETTVRTVDGMAVVSVRDYGVGIPKDKQAPIFERFYRAHTGTPYDYGGMGVALFISNEMVVRHGGRMWFESEEGEGSTFYFSLPVEKPLA